jgi:histidine kinase
MVSLRSRLFISYLLIILVGVSTLFIAASLISGAFFRADIRSILSEKGSSEESVIALNDAFNSGVQSALLIATSASLLAALAISIFMSNRLARPLAELGEAATRIASGRYSERVQAPEVKEVAELAYSFNQMAENLEEDERRRRVLVDDLAHELRTPLTAIQGHMEGLIDGVLEPTPANFGVVQREARRLQRLAEELSELSRVESAALKLNFEKLVPCEVLEEVEARVKPQFDFKGVTLVVCPESKQSPDIYADRDRLEQILINLLSNSLRYTESGGQVSLYSGELANSVEFRVIDTGIGIAPEHLEHVFERFYRADRSRSREGGGSGIGLTITQRLVEAQGGDIWIESEPGKGTTVHFSLPRVRQITRI